MVTLPFFEKNRLRPPYALALAAAAIIAVAALAYTFVHPPRTTLGAVDFNAYYCSGRVLAAHMDPYRYGPMHACELRNAVPATPNAVVPAPFPPYAITAFSLLARFPFVQSSLVWQFVLLVATLVVIWAIVDLTSFPLLVVATSVLVCVWLPSILTGALAPVPIAAMCLAAVFIGRSRWTSAAIFLAVACAEPHLAAPALVASFIVVPQMRLRIAALVAAIFAVSVLAGGRLNAEYLLNVLPAHAASELGTQGQYGLSSVLRALGMTDRAALMAGSVQYAILVGGGVWMAFRLRSRLPEGVVLIPLACAVTGGTFVHLTQIAGALPLAFILASQTGELLAWFALALVAVPWQAATDNRVPVVAGLVLAAVLGYRFGWITAAVSGLAATLAIALGQMHEPIAPEIHAIPHVPPSALAELAWRQLANQFPPTELSWAAHVLTYAGLSCVILATVRLAAFPRLPRAALVPGEAIQQRTPTRRAAPPAG